MQDFVSVDRRRRRLRLRPITVVILVVLALNVVAGLAWGVSCIIRATAIKPLAAATPTPGPAATPTPGPAGATPTPPDALHPITWTVRLDRDSTGRVIGIVDDPAVHAAVRAGFLEAWEWAFASASPHNPADLDRYLAPIPEGSDDWAFQPDPRYWYGRERGLEDLERERNTGRLIQASLESGEWRIQILRFSTDGGRAVLRGRYEGGRCAVRMVDIATGELLGVAQTPCAVYTAGMLYDPQDGRWKIATLRVTVPK